MFPELSKVSGEVVPRANPPTKKNNSDLSVSSCIGTVFLNQGMELPVADPGFSKWGGAVLSQMGGRTSCFQVKSA